MIQNSPATPSTENKKSTSDETFERLLREVDSAIEQNRKNSGMSVDMQTESIVRVYYTHYEMRETEAKEKFEEYMTMVEKCKDVCDIHQTYYQRSQHETTSKSDRLILTPGESPVQRVRETITSKVLASFTDVKLSKNECTLKRSLQIAKRIQEDYGRFKAFIVLGSYEDIDYVSTGLSFICQNLSKLVIFTGGYKKVNYPNSDSARNLIISLQIASTMKLTQLRPVRYS